MIKHTIAKQTYDEFEEHGFKMPFQTERGIDHQLSDKEIKELRKFLIKNMP